MATILVTIFYVRISPNRALLFHHLQPSSTVGIGDLTDFDLACADLMCSLCSHETVRFGSMPRLQEHLETCHLEEIQARRLFYLCPLCGKALRLERDLRGHLASKHRSHVARKDFTCSVCGQEFGYRYNLNKHMKCFHANVQLDMPSSASLS